MRLAQVGNIRGITFQMSDPRAKQKLAGVFVDAKDIDVKNASIDSALGKVWSDETTGELAVSLDRVLFDSLLDISARFLDPHGFSLNLENLLAIIDSMRLGVFATTGSKPAGDGRLVAKKLMPALYMHLPRKNSVGPLLQRFYDEIGRYESELARIQDLESKSKKIMDSAIRDDSGRRSVEMLRQENAGLRDELARMSQKLVAAEGALRAVPSAAADHQIPVGVKSCVVRSVRPSEGVVHLKSGETQFSFPLKSLGGLPALNSRALSFHEGGVPKSVWAFDPVPEPFASVLVQIIAIDGRRAKIRFPDRREQVVTMAEFGREVSMGEIAVAVFARDQLIDLRAVGSADGSRQSDVVFDEQTRRQLDVLFEGGSDD